jgi:hypothetical protein
MPDCGSVDSWSDGNSQNQPSCVPARVLAFQSIRQHDAWPSLSAILFVQCACDTELLSHRLDKRQWQDGDAIFSAFAFPHQYFASLQIHVFDPQLGTFHQPHAGAVQHAGDE